MRSILIGIILIISTSLANAQFNGEKDTMSRYRPGLMWFFSGFSAPKQGKLRKYDRLIVDLVYNDWMGDRKLFQNTWESIGVNTSLMFDIPLVEGNKMSLGVGLSYQLMNIRHDNNLIRVDSTETTQWLNKQPTDNFAKNKLVGNSFAIPVEFRFRTKGWRHFKFHVGGKIGIMANLYSKSVVGKGQNRIVTKNHNFFDKQRLLYSVHARVGIRNWAFFASYNFNPIFKNKQSIRLNHWQFGLSISLF